MGKIRTKPKFYSYDSNTVGDITEIGKNQIEIHNISLNEVFNILSSAGKLASKSIPSVSKASSINKWAAFRPYEPGWDDKYGWDSDGLELIEKHKRSDTVNFRLGDFAGYNHNALPSKLEHSPVDQVFGKDFTTTKKSDVASAFSVGFKFNEVSPPDVFGIATSDLRMFVILGTSKSGTILGSKDYINYDTASNTLWIDNIPRGFTDYGTRTFSVWWGDKTFNLPTVRWKHLDEINNEFTLRIKSFFNYQFYTEDIPSSGTFTMSIQDENYTDARPANWQSTIKIANTVQLGAGDRVDIHVHMGGSWVLERQLTSIPSSITIDWYSIYGSNQHYTEDSWYYIRATYVSGIAM